MSTDNTQTILNAYDEWSDKYSVTDLTAAGVTYRNITIPTSSVTGIGSGAYTMTWDGSTGARATISDPSINPAVEISHEGITLKDLKASGDIWLGGESLRDVLQEIRDALRIPIHPKRDPELEKEFEELQQLADEYQRKLEHYREQKRIFGILKEQDQ